MGGLIRLKIGYLYPNLLNIYGDRGNIICLVNRCRLRNIEVWVENISVGKNIRTKEYDLFFGGGGQDRQQLIVAKDLQSKASVLKSEAQRGVPILTVCGTYQLFGHYFKTHEGVKIPGISIFDAYTVASRIRKIGNIVIKLNPILNTKYFIPNTNIVGFENHSGNTYITEDRKHSPAGGTENRTIPLGTVIKGFGNNGEDKTEGAVYNHVFGCYLHGPVLPKNPHLADYLIKTALKIKYGKDLTLNKLDDQIEWQAHNKAIGLA